MSDSEKLLKSDTARASTPSDVSEHDDFGGMFLNMCKRIDPRALFIVWISFIFIHTELCAEHVLKKISGTVNSDFSLTMKGTIYASFFMTLIVAICMIVF